MKDFKTCQIGDALPPLEFSPPDAPPELGGPILEVWTSFGAPAWRDGTIYHFIREFKGAPWVRTS